jgi:hypothetical protein
MYGTALAVVGSLDYNAVGVYKRVENGVSGGEDDEATASQ